MSRAVVLAGCVAVLVAGGPGAPRPSGSTSRGSPVPVTYSAPVGQRVVVVRPFVAPASRYGAGHRGVDLGAAAGAPVLAAAVGLVRFAGAVAGRDVIVIEHPDGVQTEYEPVTPAVRTGDRVTRGQPIGRVSGRHLTCQPDRCVHWSARRDGGYFDPMTLLARLGPVRLVPW